MSVLVKGMKMPKGCHSGCPLTDSDAFTCEITGRDIVWTDEDTIACRPSWCQLVELPPHHGRLIDANKLKQAMMVSQIQHGIIGTTFGLSDAIRIINDALSVIEAE